MMNSTMNCHKCGHLALRDPDWNYMFRCISCGSIFYSYPLEENPKTEAEAFREPPQSDAVKDSLIEMMKVIGEKINMINRKLNTLISKS